MSEEMYYRRQITRQHLEVLAQYMERYPPLALASARSREGHIQSKRMWEKIARTLNRINDNVAKSGKGWARYWIDLKFKIRRKYAVIQKCQSEGTHCTLQLTPLEERIIKILTDEEGNLLSTSSVYHQMKTYHPLHYPLKTSQLNNLKPLSDSDTKIDDSGGISADDQMQDDYLVVNTRLHTEHIILPEVSDIKPNLNSINNFKNDNVTDPIEIAIPGEEKQPIEELRRELVEFELRKQKELFEMEKQFKKERHELEMSILRLKKQLLVKELKKS